MGDVVNFPKSALRKPTMKVRRGVEPYYFRKDGTYLVAGDRVDTGAGIGKFAGTWNNPNLGRVGEIRYFRYANKGEKTTLFFKPDIENNMLETSVTVA